MYYVEYQLNLPDKGWTKYSIAFLTPEEAHYFASEISAASVCNPAVSFPSVRAA